jgi:hypothetical protein
MYYVMSLDKSFTLHYRFNTGAYKFSKNAKPPPNSSSQKSDMKQVPYLGFAVSEWLQTSLLIGTLCSTYPHYKLFRCKEKKNCCYFAANFTGHRLHFSRPLNQVPGICAPLAKYACNVNIFNVSKYLDIVCTNL